MFIFLTFVRAKFCDRRWEAFMEHYSAQYSPIRASAWPVPQRTRRSRAESFSATSPHQQSRRGRPAAPSRSRLRVVRVVGAPSSLIALLGRFRMPLEVECLCVSPFLLLRLRLSFGLCALIIAAFLYCFGCAPFPFCVVLAPFFLLISSY